MKKIRLLYLTLIFPVIVFAQSRDVTGTVFDELGGPLPDASVVVQGTAKGVSTDFDGNFSITVDADSKALVISYIGFNDYILSLTLADNYEVTLEPEDNTLEEVVIIGYGSSKRKDLTGALSEVKEKAEVAAQYTSVASLLQGRSSGLQVSSNTGAPGASVSIRIRGSNSLRGNNEPLYVVDGVIINSAGEDVLNAMSDSNELQQTQNGLTGINPRDIESMTVLKDASATAIYGSRGANGVILITTKKGKQGKAQMNVFASSTISRVNETIGVLDGIQYAQYRNHSSISNGFGARYSIDGNDVYLLEQGIPTGKPLQQVNWQDEMFRMAYSYGAGANVSGATEKSNYYLSASFDYIEGTVPNTDLKSATAQFNYSNNVTEKFKIDTRIGLYIGKGNMSQGGSKSGGNRSFTRQLISYNPLVGGELEIDDPEVGQFNPYSFIAGFEEKSNEKRFNGSVSATYDFTDDLKYQLRAGSNYRNKRRSRWYGPETSKGAQTDGYLALSTLEKLSYTLDNLLIYNKRFNKHHRLNATIGITYDGSTAFNTTYEVGQFPIKNLRERSPQLGELVLTPYSNIEIKDNIFSYLGRFTYILNNRYAFNGSIRVDQSSKFREDHRTGYFPAASFAWTISNEGFLEDSNTISNFKLRASWGQVGNQGINPYQSFSNYGPVFYTNESNSTILGVRALNIANKDLTWETTTQTNLGLDFGMFNGRFSANIDVYQKETTDLLIQLPTPTSTGFGSYLINQGGLQNKGIDISLDAVIVETDDFSFSLGGNFSINRSKIINLESLDPSSIYVDVKLINVSHYFGNNVSSGNNFKSPANVFIQGQPIGLHWGYQTEGIYKDQAAADAGPTWQGAPNKAGDVVFIDLNGDGNVNDADKTNIGDPNADFTYGINSNISYKNFNLSMLFVGVEGNDILNGNLLDENIAGVGGGNNIRPAAYFDAWSIQNPNGAYPRLGSATPSEVPRDRLIEDGSYFRLSNVTLSYNLNFEKHSFINDLSYLCRVIIYLRLQIIVDMTQN